MKTRTLISFLLITPLWIFAQQRFKYKTVPVELKRGMAKAEDIDDELKERAKDLVVYLPERYNRSGEVDYTSYLQKGLMENSVILMPNFPVLINSHGLKLQSNSVIIFQAKSRLIIKPNASSSYAGLLMDSVENVAIYNPKIEGDKYTHLGSRGQWGMGIWIKHSRNIIVYGAIISKCWGDAIYIGNERSLPSQNIIIDGAFLDDNRRNGISITCGREVIIRNVLISNSNGQNPRSGIDIEPNSNNDVIESVLLHNITTYNNAMHGIVISLGSIRGENKKNVSITVTNHVDYFSTIGLGISSTRAGQISRAPQMEGVIEITNCRYYDNSHAALKNYKSLPGTSLTLKMNEISVNGILDDEGVNTMQRTFHTGAEIRVE